MDQDIEETLADIEEMAQERYIVSLGDYSREADEFELSWVNKSGRECGFCASQRLIEKLFTEMILN